jgi:hypothetical protein
LSFSAKIRSFWQPFRHRFKEFFLALSFYLKSGMPPRPPTPASRAAKKKNFFFKNILPVEFFFIPLLQIHFTELFRCAAALKYSKIQAPNHSTTRRKPNR